MNAEVKANWLQALRSGKYMQGTGYLRDSDDKYCCLGVLCDLHAQETVTKWDKPFPAIPYRRSCHYKGCISLLPQVVADWAKIPSDALSKNSGGVDIKLVDVREDKMREVSQGFTSLATLNDQGCTFAEIAQIIEAQL